MFPWLKDNAYLAEWLAALIAVVGLITSAPKSGNGSVDWPRTILYFCTIMLLAVAITPQFDTSARSLAGLMFSV
jgi:hypothetical protein